MGKKRKAKMPKVNSFECSERNVGAQHEYPIGTAR